MMKHSGCHLATSFQDLVTEVKNLVTLAPVLGAISCPECISDSLVPKGMHKR